MLTIVRKTDSFDYTQISCSQLDEEWTAESSECRDVDFVGDWDRECEADVDDDCDKEDASEPVS